MLTPCANRGDEHALNHCKSRKNCANPNNGKLIGSKLPREPRTLVDPDQGSVDKRTRGLAMFTLAIDSKLRGQAEGRRCGPAWYDSRSRHRAAENNRTSGLVRIEPTGPRSG